MVDDSTLQLCHPLCCGRSGDLFSASWLGLQHGPGRGKVLQVQQYKLQWESTSICTPTFDTKLSEIRSDPSASTVKSEKLDKDSSICLSLSFVCHSHSHLFVFVF